MTDTTAVRDWPRHFSVLTPTSIAVEDDSRRITWRELDDRVDRLVAALGARGARRGSRVAILAYNGSQFHELQFACARAGFIAVLLNWRLTVSELTYLVTDSGPHVLIHDEAFNATAHELKSRCGIPELIEVSVGDHGAYENALASVDPSPAGVVVVHDDPAAIMYTSGTTGLPKGAIITHGMILNQCLNVTQVARVTAESKALVVLPMFHSAGMNVFANPILFAGGSIRSVRAFDPVDTLRRIGDPEERITHFVGVAQIFQVLAHHPDFSSTDLTRLVNVTAGGGPLATSLVTEWGARGIPIQLCYAMTEVMVATILGGDDAVPKAGSSGRALMGQEVQIIDGDGAVAPVGTTGEVCIRGAAVTPGYWQNREATRASIIDGWLHSGDAGRLDHDGYLWIVDRWKDMYVSGGENVYPSEVENVISELPGVAEVAVIGVPSERWGETGMALVVARDGHAVDAGVVQKHCRAHLARFKVPTEVRVVDNLPRNGTGKVLKRELRRDIVGDDAPAIT